jgi:hypothetical protein
MLAGRLIANCQRREVHVCQEGQEVDMVRNDIGFVCDYYNNHDYSC